MFFRKEELEDLKNQFSKIDNEYEKTKQIYRSIKFKNMSAWEYANRGFVRRITILKRCILNIFDICPPERTQKLSEDELDNLDINLHSFIFNTYGCLDNLAWIWVKENSIKNNKGEELEAKQVGLSNQYKYVRDTFSKDFSNYLNGCEPWFHQLENFRHALAHRIPLFVIPIVFNKQEAEEFNKIQKEAHEAFMRFDFKKVEALFLTSNTLGKFLPYMTHSFEEKSLQLPFHFQIIIHWKTIIEISEKFLKELKIQKA